MLPFHVVFSRCFPSFDALTQPTVPMSRALLPLLQTQKNDMKNPLANLLKRLGRDDLKPGTEDVSSPDPCASGDGESAKELSAFELEARVLYSASPVEFTDAAVETVDIAEALSDSLVDFEFDSIAATVDAAEVLAPRQTFQLNCSMTL